MIEIKLTFANADELVAFFTGKKAVLTTPADGAKANDSRPKAEKPAATPSAGTSAKSETATASPSDPKTAAAASAPAAAAAAPVSAPAPTPSAEAGGFKYETLKAKVFELLPKLGKDAVLGVSVKHGQPKFSDLPEDKWKVAYDDLVALEGAA